MVSRYKYYYNLTLLSGMEYSKKIKKIKAWEGIVLVFFVIKMIRKCHVKRFSYKLAFKITDQKPRRTIVFIVYVKPLFLL